MSGYNDKISFFNVEREKILKEISSHKKKKVDFVTGHIVGTDKTLKDCSIYGLALIEHILRLWNENYNVPRERIAKLCAWSLTVRFNNEEVINGKEKEE